MSQIILDFGSGNNCLNDKKIIKKMYDELKAIDNKKHSIVCKWQLFKRAGKNVPLLPENFDFAYKYGTNLGYNVTSSVFDKPSLDLLLKYNPCFIKIANRRDLDWLIGEIPRKTEIYISYSERSHIICKRISNVKYMACISNYPATNEDYEKKFDSYSLKFAISDHTIGTELYKKYQPMIWEKHYKLNDSTGLDAGEFSITPEQLKEVL